MSVSGDVPFSAVSRVCSGVWFGFKSPYQHNFQTALCTALPIVLSLQSDRQDNGVLHNGVAG
jgi:hypothetical protein